jgi:hypothetical protein
VLRTRPGAPAARPLQERARHRLRVLQSHESERARASELVASGSDHRLKVPEIGRVDVDLGGDDDLVLGRDRLGVIALRLWPRRESPTRRRHYPSKYIGNS